MRYVYEMNPGDAGVITWIANRAKCQLENYNFALDDKIFLIRKFAENYAVVRKNGKTYAIPSDCIGVRII